MKTKLRLLIGIVTILLVASVSYMFIADRDAYKHHTGLGSGLDVSADDQRIAFSFYNNGSEAIYTAVNDGKDVKKVSHPKKVYHRKPQFSPDGRKLLFLSQNDQIQSLYTVNADGSNPEKLSNGSQHVSEAIFSEDGETIFFASMPADEFMKSEGETQEGYDLFSVNLDGTELDQLTDNDFFSMDSLVLSAGGTEILFQDFEGIYSYKFEEKQVNQSDFSKQMPSDMFHLTISTKWNALAYTAVSEESENDSLFKYELFLKDLTSGDTQRLTDLKTAVVSPVFFNKQERILFLENVNWPAEPEEYKLLSVDVESGKVQNLTLDLPDLKTGNLLMKAIDYSVNGWTVGLLYTLLLMLFTVYLQGAGKVFLPSLISLGIAIVSFASSFIVASAYDPWAGIAVGMVAAALMACTLLSFLFAFGLKFFRKGVK